MQILKQLAIFTAAFLIVGGWLAFWSWLGDKIGSDGNWHRL